MSQVIFSGQTGCLLPLLIILNLLFGRPFFNSIYIWLGVEAALIIIFIIKMHIFVRKIAQQFSPMDHDSNPGSRSHWSQRQGHGPSDKVVDVEGKVVEDKEKLT